MVFVIIIVAIITVGRIVRAGMGLEERKLRLRGGSYRDSGSDEIARLQSENASLRGKIGRLEDRMAVLERIATDAPARLSAQIDELR
jgi:hypothetical protein